MLESDYHFAWFMYGVAAVVSIWLVITGTSWIKQLEIRWTLRALVLVLLFTPVKVDPNMNLVAPAFIAVLLDAVVINTDAGMQRLQPLLIALGFSIVTVLLGCGWWRAKRSK